MPGPQPTSPPSSEEIERTLARFRGTFDQAPPAFSAVKIQGRRAYDLARAGQEVAPQPRPVTVHELELVDWAWPVLSLRIRCAKGFYVRSLARDLAVALGLAGHCLSIRRTAVGPYGVEVAMALPLNEPCPPVTRALLPLQPPDAAG